MQESSNFKIPGKPALGREFFNWHYDYGPMTSQNADTLAAELLRRAEEKFGAERAEALRPDLRQMAGELESLHTCGLEFDDEP